MNVVDFRQVEYEINQTKKALLEHFELIITDQSVWQRSRKKILDSFGDDGLLFRMRNLFNGSNKEGSGNVI